MRLWRVYLAMILGVVPLWVIAVDSHLMHRLMWAFAAMPIELIAISLGQDDGGIRKHKEPTQ